MHTLVTCFFSTHNYRFAATSSDAMPFNFLLAEYLLPKINYNIVFFLITHELLLTTVR